MSIVALTKYNDRKKNISEALKLIEHEIKDDIESKKPKNIIIKPNFVSASVALSATHVDAIRATLDFLSFWNKNIIIAESAAEGGSTFDGYKNYGYMKLKDEYDIELMDLDDDDYEMIDVIGKGILGEKSIPIRVSRIMLDPNNYIISVTRLKTHDTVIATLSLKNVLVGSILGNDKSKIHQGIKEINHNLFLLAKRLKPDLAVIDGQEGMQGDGPVSGEAINVGVALASLDSIACDRVALEIMGIPAEDVGYLVFCGESKLGEYDLKKINVIGENIENCKKTFKLHSSISWQLRWK